MFVLRVWQSEKFKFKALWFYKAEAIRVSMLKGLENHNNAVDGAFYDAINPDISRPG